MMKILAQIIMILIGSTFIIHGMVDLFTPDFLPQQELIIGMASEQVKPEMLRHFVGQMRVLGGAMIAFGIIMMIMTFKGTSSKYSFFYWLIPVSASLILIPMTIRLRLDAQPWWIPFSILVMVIIASLSLYRESIKKPDQPS